jgi:hypothetical protein
MSSEEDASDFWALGEAMPPPSAMGIGNRKRGREEEGTVGSASSRPRPGERVERGGASSGGVPWRHARVTAATLMSFYSAPGGSSDRGSASSGRESFSSLPSKAPLLRLHEEILDFAAFMSPTPSEAAIAGRALSATTAVIMRLFPAARVEVFGSRSQGLVLPTSDWDLVLLGVRPDAATMYRLASELKLAGAARSTEVIASARIPIVKLVDATSGIGIDISFEAVSGLASRAVISDLLARFPPLRALVTTLKYFLIQRGLNDTYTGGVGSFLLVCMCTAAVQAALRNTVAVEQMASRSLGSAPAKAAGSPFARIPHAALQKLNLGALLVQTLELFGSNLNYATTGISVRGDFGGFYDKARKGWFDPNRPMLLSLESPADIDQDVGKNSWAIQKVRRAFQTAHTSLARGIRAYAPPSSSLPAAVLEATLRVLPSAQSAPASLLACIIRIDGLLRDRVDELAGQIAEARANSAAPAPQRSLREPAPQEEVPLPPLSPPPSEPARQLTDSAAKSAEDINAARLAALAHLQKLASGRGGVSKSDDQQSASDSAVASKPVVLRHTRLLADLLTRKERGISSVTPAPEGGGWY